MAFPQRVHIVAVRIVDNGDYTRAAMYLRIDAAAEPTTFAWQAGVIPEHQPCNQAIGWRLDLRAEPLVVPSNEPREVWLRAWSGNRPACAPEVYVAKCGERVTLVLMSDDDVVLATRETRYECMF